MLTNDRIGLVVNAKNAWPSAQEIDNLGAAWVRSIVYDDSFDQFDAALQTLPDGAKVIALLNRENQFNDQPRLDWIERVTEFAQRFAGRVAVLECLNEWDAIDLWGDGVPEARWPEDLRVARDAERVTRVVGRMKEARPILKNAGIACLLGSVAGGRWPDMLGAAVAECGEDLPDGVCLHPYGQRAAGFPPGRPGQPFGFGELQAAVSQATGIAGLPVWVTEFGLNLNDADLNKGDGFDSAEAAQAHYVSQSFEVLGELSAEQLQVACLFSWIDRIGSERDGPFGLRPEPEQPARQSWTAYRECTHGAG